MSAKHSAMGCGGCFVAGLIILMVTCGLTMVIQGPMPRDTSLDAAKIAPTAELQTKREDFINKELIQKLKIFSKIDPRSSHQVRVYTGRSWDQLTFEQKESFCNTVWAFYFQGVDATGHLPIYNGYTGKKVGSYSYRNGGLSLD